MPWAAIKRLYQSASCRGWADDSKRWGVGANSAHDGPTADASDQCCPAAQPGKRFYDLNGLVRVSENFDRRIATGMLVIVMASWLLSWQGALEFGSPWGSICIIGACGCWAADNNLTRQLSIYSPLHIAYLLRV